MALIPTAWSARSSFRGYPHSYTLRNRERGPPVPRGQRDLSTPAQCHARPLRFPFVSESTSKDREMAASHHGDTPRRN